MYDSRLIKYIGHLFPIRKGRLGVSGLHTDLWFFRRRSTIIWNFFHDFFPSSPQVNAETFGLGM